MRLLTIPKRSRVPLRRSDQSYGAIQRHYVASSAISPLIYDPDTETCWVHFTDGASVELSSLPGIELERWLAAKSIGAYWNNVVRGRY
jgi:hypothetical protein